MPTFTHGKKTKFYISDGTSDPDVTGTTQVAVAKVYEISQVCKEVSFPNQMDTAETSTFGSNSKGFVQGLRSGTLSVSGSWDGLATITDTTTANAATPDAILSGLIGAENEVKFVYCPAGNAVGAVKFSGKAIMTSYQVSGSIGDLVAFSAEFQVTTDGTEAGVTREVFTA